MVTTGAAPKNVYPVSRCCINFVGLPTDTKSQIYLERGDAGKQNSKIGRYMFKTWP
jgi:hypothetical protein